MIFSGTAATYGHGRAVVTATGMETQMGRIAGMLKDAPEETTPLSPDIFFRRRKAAVNAANDEGS